MPFAKHPVGSFRKGATQHAEKSPSSGKGHTQAKQEADDRRIGGTPPNYLPVPVWIDTSPQVSIHKLARLQDINPLIT